MDIKIDGYIVDYIQWVIHDDDNIVAWIYNLKTIPMWWCPTWWLTTHESFLGEPSLVISMGFLWGQVVHFWGELTHKNDPWVVHHQVE